MIPDGIVLPTSILMPQNPLRRWTSAGRGRREAATALRRRALNWSAPTPRAGFEDVKGALPTTWSTPIGEALVTRLAESRPACPPGASAVDGLANGITRLVGSPPVPGCRCPTRSCSWTITGELELGIAAGDQIQLVQAADLRQTWNRFGAQSSSGSVDDARVTDSVAQLLDACAEDFVAPTRAELAAVDEEALQTVTQGGCR